MTSVNDVPNPSERVESTTVDERGVMWETVTFDNGTYQGTLTRAVCRPESCANGHQCGQLDPGPQPAGAYSIGSDHWPGLSKLVEETGELGQVLGKIMGTGGAVEHGDGSNLRDRLVEEMGDVYAALDFVRYMNGIDQQAVTVRHETKLAQFVAWHYEQGGGKREDKPLMPYMWTLSCVTCQEVGPGFRVRPASVAGFLARHECHDVRLICEGTDPSWVVDGREHDYSEATISRKMSIWRFIGQRNRGQAHDAELDSATGECFCGLPESDPIHHGVNTAGESIDGGEHS